MRKLEISAVWLVMLGSVAMIGSIPCTVGADMINAPAAYFATQTEGPQMVNYVDKTWQVTSTTIPLQYITNSTIITNGMAAQFAGTNFAFAGSGVASNIANIDPSDFTVNQYNPWVINNNSTTNFVNGPNFMKYSLGLTNLDAGGADILILYTPQNNNDPFGVNFLQGTASSFGNGPLSTGTIDNGGQATPFYNPKGVSGTGAARLKASPLGTAPDEPAWMIDIPSVRYIGSTTYTRVFEAFIESTVPIMVNGTSKDYDVLYGGVEWGYTVTSTVVPEPASLILLAEVVAIAAIAFLWRNQQCAQSP